MATLHRAGNSYAVIATPHTEYVVEADVPVSELKAKVSPLVPTRVLDATARKPEHDGDVIDQLKRLGQLREAGVLTDDEFQAKKRDLLGRL